MNESEALARLLALRDEAFGEFQRRLIPNTALPIIGVRTPALRALAKEAAEQSDTAAFLAALPHRYFDENQLHAFILSREKDFQKCLAGVEAFLPCVDNWATCDQLSPACFRRHRAELLPAIWRWLASGRVYTVRFAVGMLMQHYLDGDFDPAYPEAVAALRSDQYYVNMMIAWYFATALAKQYGAALPYLENRRLDAWTHRKAIQKALESRRITPEKKEYLKSLRDRA